MARGIPNNAVECAKCGKMRGAPRDGLCGYCRNSAHMGAPKVWTPAMEAQLRRGYQEAKKRTDLTDALNHMTRATGLTRQAIVSHASELGLGFCIHRRDWTPTEEAYLEASCGSVSCRTMARKLNRGFNSVNTKIHRMGLLKRVLEGYSAAEFAEVIGVNVYTIRQWERKGILTREAKNGWAEDGRFTEDEVREFVFKNPDKYDLRRVDQVWFKGVVFPAFTKTSAQWNKRRDGEAAPHEYHLALGRHA